MGRCADSEMYRNFIGQKITFKVVMQPGVDVEISSSQKDELVISGNSLEGVSQSAADIQQTCRVRNKDIRKVGSPPSFGCGGRIEEGMLTLPTVPGRPLRFAEGQHRGGVRSARPRFFCVLYGSSGVTRGSMGICMFRSTRGYTQKWNPFENNALALIHGGILSGLSALV